MTDLAFTELLPLGPDDTPYRLLTTDGVATVEAAGRTFLQVEPEVLTLLTRTAFRDIAHWLRPAHLAQLRRILDDPEASANDRFVALDLLKNANIAAGGVLPMCQDTGTAIVMGKRGERVLTGGDDERAISLGIQQTYETSALRFSQMAPLTMWDEKNTGTNLPAQIELYATAGDAYKLLFMAKGGGSANKSYLFQETKAVLNRSSMLRFLDEKLRTLGTAACPPYHLAVVIGGTSAEFALKTAKYASAHYLDALPTAGSRLGHGFRDLELEADVLALTQGFGIGAQFGGKYFCHDVRVVRLPRHGASCPVAVAVSCSADRQALGKITADGVFLEQLEEDPAGYLPEVTHDDLADDDVVRIDLNRPMDEIRAELTRYPVKTRLSLTGRWSWPATSPTPRSRSASTPASRCPRTCATTASTTPARPRRPRATPVGLLRAHHRGAHGLLRRGVPGRRRLVGDAGQGQPQPPGHRRLRRPRRLLPRLDRRAGGPAGPGLHPQGRGARVPRAGHGGRVEDRGRGLPRLHRRRRQGQRLLRSGEHAGQHLLSNVGQVAPGPWQAARCV